MLNENNFETVAGLEIHAELNTKSKVFCSCENSFGGAENSKLCPMCMGLPGALPTLNKKVVELAVKAGLALNCKVQNYSTFDRKNYCYPDLPKAYQITQFYNPVCRNGFVAVKNKKIGIKQIHIEEDAGKLIHLKNENITLADYNRCSVPLIEIVSDPDLNNGEEARLFAEEIALILKYLNVCNCQMEKGNLRCDVNISVKPKNSKTLGNRTEIKNLNSFRAVQHAVEAESKRQIELILKGEKIKRETLHFDDLKGTLTVMRNKEDTEDYRYFPEPDLPSLVLGDEYIQNISKSLPELPLAKIKRYTAELSVPLADAKLIVSHPETAELFEKAAENTADIKALVSLINVELPRLLKNTSITESKITPTHLRDICNMLSENKISGLSAKNLLKMCFENGKNAKYNAETAGMILKNNTDEIYEVIKRVIKSNGTAAEQYKTGSKKVLGFLIGETVKSLGSSANPKLIKELLIKELEK